MERTETRINWDLLDAVRVRAIEDGRDDEELVVEMVGRYLSAPRQER